MKLVIELDKVAYDLLTGKIETANIDLFSTLIKSVKNGTSLVEKLEKIIAKIDSEEKWLINIKTKNGFIPMIDICNAMYRIRRTISELKGEDK